MSNFHKVILGLATLSLSGFAGTAHAMANLDVKPTVTGSAGAYTYSYAVTPGTVQFIGDPFSYNPTTIGFTFADPSIAFQSADGPLQVTQNAPGRFTAGGPLTTEITKDGSFTTIPFGATPFGASLPSGSTENFVFSSANAPQNNALTVTSSDGIIGSSGLNTYAGPAAVPEASTTVSLGLLLTLGGLGVVAARRSKKTAAGQA